MHSLIAAALRNPVSLYRRPCACFFMLLLRCLQKISVAAAGREQVPQLPDAQAQVLALESALAPLLGNTPSMLADGLPGLTSLGHVIAAYASRGLQGAPLQPWNLWDWMVAAGAAYMIPGFPGHHVTQFKVLQDAWDAYEFKAGTSST